MRWLIRHNETLPSHEGEVGRRDDRRGSRNGSRGLLLLLLLLLLTEGGVLTWLHGRLLLGLAAGLLRGTLTLQVDVLYVW